MTTTSSSLPINLYYWRDVPNFGDSLSPYLISKLTHRKVEFKAEDALHKLVAVGSLLCRATLFSSSYIWGSGALSPHLVRKAPLFNVKRHLERLYESSFRRSKIYAIRGPLTAQQCELLGFNVPDVYGDPGILLPRIYTPKNLNTSSEQIGLILHHTQSSLLQGKELPKNLKLIDIHRQTDSEIESFIDEVVSCKTIFSSSLHGIVVAQAYGIPAQWITVKNLPIHKFEEFKFNDYFLGTKQNSQQPLCLDLMSEDLYRLRDVRPEIIREMELKHVADRLIESFPPPIGVIP